MSGQVGEERAVQVLKAGASDFLPKARLERLALVIDRELAEVQAQTALDLFSEVQLQERLRQAEARLRHLSLHQSESHELQMANLSHELHDHLGQVLGLLKLHLSAAARRDLPSARRDLEIDQALPLVDMALGRLREVCGDLWPSELRDFGLGPELAGVCRAAARASGIAVTCTRRVSRVRWRPPACWACSPPSHETLPREVRVSCCRPTTLKQRYLARLGRAPAGAAAGDDR